ncbi:MAG: c-type cytochrome [Planctomycetaceae bacterium]|nr:c-type cytochrome [Planctomycetaceae bacterium]
MESRNEPGRHRLCWAVLMSIGMTCGAVLQAAQPLRSIGVARVDITPDYPVRLNGFGGRRAESEGVRQHLWAKALAVGTDDEGPAVLITVDTLGIPADIVQGLAKTLKEKASVPIDRLTVTATHTHSAPMLTNVTPTLFGMSIPAEHQAHIDRYTAEFSEKLERLALAALKDRRPARLEWGVGRAGFAANRRTKGGPVDHDLPVLVVRNPDDTVRAIYVNYACHAVTLSDNQVNGDWPGYAQEHIEQAHPGATALISAGCGADADPNSGVTGGKFEIASQQGLEIAAEVERMLKAGLQPVTGDLKVQYEVIDLPFDKPPAREEFEQLAKRTDATGYHARVQLARLDRNEALRKKISYPVQTWAFGDSLAMVFLPGEVVVDYSTRLKRELDRARLWVNAYANDAPCYIPSERVLKEGGYEGGLAMVYYDQPTRLAPGLEQLIVDSVRRQLDSGFLSVASRDRTPGAPRLTPQQSLATIRTKPGLTVELVAAEPLVVSPVAVEFGPDGRLWVAEMYDYPEGIDGQYKPGGRVRVLESTNEDGKFDKATVFLDGVPFPTGVTVWRKGLLVCSAPDILYAEDTDGDGRADLVKKLYSGFGDLNYQGRVNSLEIGLDGWLYGSCGAYGGRISRFTGGEPLALGDRDFRIKPDSGEIEPATGRTLQGRPRDDWGNWFGNDSGTLCRHYPFPDHYLRRNPYFVPPQSAVFVPSGPDPSRLYPLSQGLQLFKLSGPSGRPTGACGLGLYRDTVLGEGFQGDAFICEPVNLLVHRMRLVPKGTTFEGPRADDEQDSEFLASTDGWFRPVQARTGPDGALWIVDMHRYVIEHPRWIPPEDVARLDVRAGHDMGRLFRVRAADRPQRPWPRLDRLDAKGLVAALDSDNGWQRDMAMQMLLWKNDKTVAPLLERLAASHERPATRLQALCTLEGLGAISVATLRAKINDSHPGVRRHALRISERFLADEPALGPELLKRLDDDPQVRLQLACTLGEWRDPRAAKALAALAVASDDPYQQAAVLSSLRPDNVAEVVAETLRLRPRGSPAGSFLPKLLGTAAPLSDPAALPGLLEQIVPRGSGKIAPWQWTAMADMVEALERRGESIGEQPRGTAQHELVRWMVEARRVAEDDQADPPLRLAALSLIGHSAAARDADLATLEKLLAPQQSAAMQQAAATALGRIADRRAVELVLANWKGHSPALKSRLLDLLFTRRDGLAPLLEKVAEGEIPVNDFDATRRQRLLEHREASIRLQAIKLFAGASDPDRAKVISQYKSALELPGARARGKVVFAQTCTVCHRLEEVGHTIGPDLAALAKKSPQALLQEILDPSRNLDNRYAVYTALTKSGRTFSGLLATESAASITLLGQESKQEVLLRVDLDELIGTGKSLMPEGLERDLSPQNLADLLAYLTSSGPVAKAIAGNQPAVVKPVEGALALSAARASIFGNQIAFEEPLGNIGFWHGSGDHVVWSVELPTAAEFDVWFDWACDDASAGNAWLLSGASPALRGTVESTGGWNQYRQKKVGTVGLDAGAQRIKLAPEGNALRGALLDLRAVLLVPKGSVPKVPNEAAAVGVPAADSPDPSGPCMRCCGRTSERPSCSGRLRRER